MLLFCISIADQFKLWEFCPRVNSQCFVFYEGSREWRRPDSIIHDRRRKSAAPLRAVGSLSVLDVGNFPTYDESSLWESILENPKPRAEIKRKRPQQYGLNRHELYFGNWIAQ